ncbi:MAG TPA: SDR family oxidoreductase [Gemmatimonadaceae bacterium]|nr:SDR family oxidoreductase [Gemmatimonadaceae bacterium]
MLVTGGTGTLGTLVTRRLLDTGHRVRIMTRNQMKTDDLKKRGASIVKGDLRDVESLEFALRGASTVISATHSMLGKGDAALEIVDDEGIRSLIDAAKRAGVGHFIFVSVFGAALDHPIDFWQTKARVERYLRDSGLDYTIIRPTAFMEMHAYELIGKFVEKGKRVVMFGSGKNPRNFVATGDVAKMIVAATDDPGMRGETVEIGGPENLSSNQVAEIFGRISGKKAKVTHLPIAVGRAASVAAQRVHPGVSRVIKSAILSETADQSFDSSELVSRYPIKLTRLEEWAKAKA